MGREVDGNWARMGTEMGREGVGGQEERRQMEEAEPPAAGCQRQRAGWGWRMAAERGRGGSGMEGWRDGKRERGSSGAGV